MSSKSIAYARRFAAASVICLLGATPVSAQMVQLESGNGEIQINGELIDFADGRYSISTTLGMLSIAADSVSCTGLACPQKATPILDFRIAGSDTIGEELMPLLIKGMAEVNRALVSTIDGPAERQRILTAISDDGRGAPAFTALLEDKGSSTGFKAVLAGMADIAMSSRPIKSSEVDAFKQAGLGDPLSFEQENEIAVDGLLIITNPANPVSALSEKQISDLLSGQITNWSELGGDDVPVQVFSRNSQSGTFATISARFLEPYNATLSPEAVIVSGNQDLTDSVFGNPGGFGYVGFAFLADNKAVDLLSSCGLTVPASMFSAKTEEYPLQRKLYLYHGADTLPETAQALVEYATSPKADEAVAKAGFINKAISANPQTTAAAQIRTAIDATQSPSEKALMRELYIDMLDWDRLSATFRFRSGTSELSNTSRRDLLRLVDYVKDLPESAQLALVGFTDSDGSFAANQALSQARAAALEEQLTFELAGIGALDKIEIVKKGFGETNPVSCNDNPEGQRLNRRVEVWIRSQS